MSLDNRTWERLAKLQDGKASEYDDCYVRLGHVLDAIFPDGLPILGARDFTRFHLFHMQLLKLVRYAIAFEEGHPDSLDDNAVYAQLLRKVDTGKP